jgi:hypothetical protein
MLSPLRWPSISAFSLSPSVSLAHPRPLRQGDLNAHYRLAPAIGVETQPGGDAEMFHLHRQVGMPGEDAVWLVLVGLFHSGGHVILAGQVPVFRFGAGEAFDWVKLVHFEAYLHVYCLMARSVPVFY